MSQIETLSCTRQPLPILYSFRRCPYAMRARMALYQARYPCLIREVVLAKKPSEMLAASSKGTVPVLVLPDEGHVIDESLDIMLHALGHRDHAGWLKPETADMPGSAASTILDDMRVLIALVESDFKPHLDRYKYASRYQNSDAFVERDHAMDFLITMACPLNTTAFLYGTAPKLADIAIFPFVRQFANTDRSWFDEKAPSRLKNWLQTLTESALFNAVMQKYPPWRKGDAEPVFPALPLAD